MSAKRVITYMPDALVDALNRATVTSPRSRSEIICAAVERYLAEDSRPQPAAAPVSPDAAFFDRLVEMMQSGLLQPGVFTEPASGETRPKTKLWIN